MPRLLAIDYGIKRTGIAITDELQLIASGLTTVNSSELIRFLSTYFTQEKVCKVVVGEPKQMNGLPSESAPLIDAFVRDFQLQFPDIAIERFDERFTSKLAFQSLISGGAKKRQRQNKGLIDEIAATILLQDYLTRNVL